MLKLSSGLVYSLELPAEVISISRKLVLERFHKHSNFCNFQGCGSPAQVA